MQPGNRRQTLIEGLLLILLAALALLAVTSAGAAADWIESHMNPDPDYYDVSR